MAKALTAQSLVYDAILRTQQPRPDPTAVTHAVHVDSIFNGVVSLTFDNQIHHLRVGNSLFIELEPGWVLKGASTTLPEKPKEEKIIMRKLFDVVLVNREDGDVKQSFQLAASEMDACMGAILDAGVAKPDFPKWVQKARFVVDVPLWCESTE